MQEEHDVVRDRANALAREQHEFMAALVQLREDHGLRQEDVAERLGVTQAAVSKIERYDANPTLSTIRRYALAVGARLRLQVVDDSSNRRVELDDFPMVQSESAPVEVDWANATSNAPCYA